MKPGVWLGGAPCVPAYWRWGDGHEYPAGYAADGRQNGAPGR